MVQFSFLALAAALATASAASSGAPIAKKTIKLGDRNLRRGDPATDALLKKAIPYKGKKHGKKAGARRLDGEEDEFEIDGTYSLQFSECVDIKTFDEDLFDEDIVSYVKAGQIVAAKSYVLFHVCQDDTCYLEAEDDIYIVDLATYMTNVATYHANKRTDYCDQCDQFEDYCNPEEEEAEEEAEEDAEEEAEDDESEDEDQEDEQEDEEEGDEEDGEEEEDRRKLKKVSRKTKKTKRKLTRKGNKKLSAKAIERKLANNAEYIDCNQCASYACYAEDAEEDEDADDAAQKEQNQQELDENVSEWIANLGECVETGVQWNNLDLYVGAMCSPYGDGVELAVFANDECTWYTNQKQFSDVYNYANDENNEYNVNYMYYAENHIKSAFSEVLPCLEKEYADPDEEEDDNENEDENEEEEYRVNEYCEAVMEEDAISLANCDADEEEEEENDDDVAANNAWFTYDMKEADDVNQVCATINKMESADYSHVYEEESSGTWYKRNKKGRIVNSSDQSEGLSGSAVAAIVAVIACVLVAAGFFLMKAKSIKTMDAEYQGGEMS